MQQYLQHEHYALWEVIEFGDSYEAPENNPSTTTTSTTSGDKSGRTVTLTTEDMQKKKNDVKARTTLMLSLPDEHQLRFTSRFSTPPLACAFFSLRATVTSSSKLARDQTSNPTSSANPTPKDRIRRSSIQKVENSHFKENLTPVDTMTDNRTMAEMLRAPTEGCAEAIVGQPVGGLKKNPPCTITTWDDLVSKFINELFPPSRTTNLRNEILNFQQKFDESFHEACKRYKDLLRACPHYGFTELHQFDTFYNALNPADQDPLNAAAGGNLLEKSPQDALTIIENKSKVRNSRSKPIASLVKAYDNHSSSELAKLTHAVNKQTSAVNTAMTAMLKQFQSNPPPAQVKAVEEICVTYRATGNYNQGNPGYRPQGVANQMRPPEKIKRMYDVSLKAMQNQIDMVKNELRNEMKTSIQTYLSNQTNEIKNMMASLLQMNTASTSGSGTLPGNTIANLKGELKAITTRSGLVTEGHTVPNPPKPVNPDEDECVKETYTDPDHAEYNIKVPP
nr:hypothetical protein [Tanacetum cinerariifolium]